MSSGSDLGNIAGTIISPVTGLIGALTGGGGGGFGPNITDQERGFTEQLGLMAAGQGPSAAALQMQQGMELANRNAMGMAAANRGINPGLAAEIAARQQQLNQMETNQQAGLMRSQEQLQANQLLGSQLASQRASYNAADSLNSQKRAQDQQLFGNILSSAGKAGTAAQMSNGGVVPGKPVFGGDHPKNDTVPAMLSPGEVVVPRTVVKMGPEAVAAFAMAVSKHGAK